MTESADSHTASAASHVTVSPLSIHIGAQIGGVDLRSPLTPAEIGVIRQALLDWKVIFFRDQNLDHRQHIEFARQFGEPTPAHAVFDGHQQFPEIYPVTRQRTAFAARPAAARAWTDWHTDVTAAVNPPFASILRAVIVPPYGGDTQWCNMAAAYRALSPTLQAFLRERRSTHRFKPAGDNDDAKDYNRKVQANPLVAEHPLVVVHPETGEHSLYTSAEFSRDIIGLTARESEVMLEFLWEHSVRSEFCVRFKWEPGSIAFWDNRSTQHQAIRDVYDSDFEREFYRVTLNGEIPKGVDGKSSTRISGEPITAQARRPE